MIRELNAKEKLDRFGIENCVGYVVIKEGKELGHGAWLILNEKFHVHDFACDGGYAFTELFLRVRKDARERGYSSMIFGTKPSSESRKLADWLEKKGKARELIRWLEMDV